MFKNQGAELPDWILSICFSGTPKSTTEIGTAKSSPTLRDGSSVCQRFGCAQGLNGVPMLFPPGCDSVIILLTTPSFRLCDWWLDATSGVSELKAGS
jgi:hypothetical protein